MAAGLTTPIPFIIFNGPEQMTLLWSTFQKLCRSLLVRLAAMINVTKATIQG